MWKSMLDLLESMREHLEDASEPESDLHAVVRVELANLLARASVLLKALAESE